MGQCGCGDTSIDRAVKVGRRVLAYDIYRGCRDCCSGPGVTIYLFDSQKSARRWDAIPDGELKPDEHGGNQGYGISFSLFEVEDLCAEARELWKEGSIGRREDQYANLNDWLHDFGLRLIQGAIWRSAARKRQERKV